MAQLALTFAGGVLGGAVAGGLGQSLGALFGAYLGGILDRDLLGPQEDRRPIEGARIAEFNLSGSAYGQTIPMIFGRMRVPANIIWVRGIREVVRTETETVGSEGGGGKGGLGGGGGRGTQTVTRTTYHYYADVALAVCEGPVTSIYRVWLDRTPLDPEHVSEVRTYYGDEMLAPDPLIQAVEGADLRATQRRKIVMKYVLGRLREPSTYAGIAAVLAAFNLSVPEEIWGYVVQVGIGVAGLVAAFVPDRSAGLTK